MNDIGITLNDFQVVDGNLGYTPDIKIGYFLDLALQRGLVTPKCDKVKPRSAIKLEYKGRVYYGISDDDGFIVLRSIEGNAE